MVRISRVGCAWTRKIAQRLTRPQPFSALAAGSRPPAGGARWRACWLPVRGGLTPHGLRHSHKTWMACDGVAPEILARPRLGHPLPGMRGLYAHAWPAADARGPDCGSSCPIGNRPSGIAPPSIRTPRSRCSTTCWRHFAPHHVAWIEVIRSCRIARGRTRQYFCRAAIFRRVRGGVQPSGAGPLVAGGVEGGLRTAPPTSNGSGK